VKLNQNYSSASADARKKEKKKKERKERNRHFEPKDTGRNPVVFSFYYYCWFLNHWDLRASSG
jgi:hypothetical protein